MRILLTIITCFFLAAAFGQKQKFIAGGSSTDLYINHKVASKETYSSIGNRYNISPQKIAYYNNLEFHNGKLLAKYLKVPLSSQNFVRMGDTRIVEGLTPVFKKANGKMGIIGYLNRGLMQPKISEDASREDLSSSIKDSVREKTTNADSIAGPSRDSVTMVAPQPVVAKKVTAVSKEFRIDNNKANRKRGFFRPKEYVKEFFSSAVTLTVITFCLIGLIYFYLSVKKKAFLSRQRLKTHVVKLISTAIINEDEDQAAQDETFELPRMLMKQFQSKDVRQLVIDELIVAKKSLRGKAALNLVQLYTYLGLLKDSLEKLKSEKWYIKAKGIQELAMMDQSKMMLPIFRQTNSKNEFVRMEAQSAIVHFGGFKGLRFLHILTYPISDWQQIKLIEQLSLLSEKELPDANKLLQSKNHSVVIFTLKIISVFHNLALHDDVIQCLHHVNPDVRYHAIKCLTNIYDDTTALTLQDVYTTEVIRNRIAILQTLKVVGSTEQADFLYLQLFEDDDSIKLAAASALIECCPDALELIGEVSSQKGYPYTNILHHIKEGLTV